MKNIILIVIFLAGIMSAQTSTIPNIVNDSNSPGSMQQKQEQAQNLQQKPLLGNLTIVLFDMDSKKPVSAAKITLAPKKEKGKDEDEFTIDTSLTGLSDERGEVHIQNVKAGEYVVVQMLPNKNKSELNGKVVTWGRTPTDPQFHLSLGPAIASHGNMSIVDGAFVIANAYMEVDGLGFRTTAKGRLLTVSVPRSGRAPIRIEIPNPAKATPAKYGSEEGNIHSKDSIK